VILGPQEIRGNFPNIAKISGLQTKSYQTITYLNLKTSDLGIITPG
jgi:hypothetical protein